MIVPIHRRQPETSISIQTEYIKLESLLKLANAVESGGMAKTVILDGLVTVNGEVCTMRGKKLRPGDRIHYDGKVYLVTNADF